MKSKSVDAGAPVQAERHNSQLSPTQMAELSVVEVLATFASGELTSEAYVCALLERAEQLKHLNSWITLNGEGAIAAARAVDSARARGDKLGALAGLPMLVKDNITTQGIRTTGATPAFKDHVPTRNAPVLEPFLEAGAIVLGKANLHELAFGSTSSNAAFGFVKNPYDVDRIPGGSSGGTAAGVAARIAPAGLGTDTGASVRNPASFCGLVGLRPSRVIQTVGGYLGRRLPPGQVRARLSALQTSRSCHATHHRSAPRRRRSSSARDRHCRPGCSRA